MDSFSSDRPPSRRQFLQMGVAGTVAGLAAGGLDLALPAPLAAQSAMTPDGAIKALMEGNKRFMSGKLTSFDEDLKILRQHTEGGQQPFVGVLSCADSRVPVELVFDQSIGHIFVARVAGNVITPEIIGSMEYGAAVLGIKAILVLGHSSCGAVDATIKGKAVPGQISSLFPHIQPGVDQGGMDSAAATKANASIQAKLLSEASTVIAPMVKNDQFKVVAGYYDLGSGAVSLL